MSLLTDYELQLLALIPKLPDGASTTLKIGAAYKGVSEKTLRRSYPTVKIGERRTGVRIGNLRHGPEWKTASTG
jgi:hypothetical protein